MNRSSEPRTPRPAARGLLRRPAAVVLVTAAAVAAAGYFLMPGEGRDLLAQPGIDGARAQSQSAADGRPSHPQVAVMSDAASNAELLAESYETTLTVASGDTLMALLTDAGLDRPQAHRAIQALAEVFSPRRLKPGQELSLTLRPGGPETTHHLEALRFTPDTAREIALTRSEPTDGDEAAFEADAQERALDVRHARARGEIDSSLYKAARDAGVPMPVLTKMIKIFSFDIDFQRDIHPGDGFALLYEDLRTPDGDAAGTGEVLIAEMTVDGEARRYYRFEDASGRVDYFDTEGHSVRKALLRTPVDGARLSSGFGKRRHPISGYTRMHKGIDFAAPTGTPIYAAGDGVVERAGYNGGYGRFVQIRHNGTYETAYAHMSRLAVNPGERVQQREVIGYIGSTGNSTGPHLHYEVRKNGQQVNPQDIDLPTGKKLAGAELEDFREVRAELETQYAEAYSLGGTETAAAKSGASDDACEAAEAASC